MEELKKLERPLMNEKEFKSYVKDIKRDTLKDFTEHNILHLKTFEAVGKFKSVRRAIRKGYVSLDGVIYPKRPFNNAKHHPNSLNNKKKKIYEYLKQKQIG